MKFKEFPLPPRVRPIPGEPLRFHVQSRANPAEEYLVDLEECGFNGACGCMDFQMRQLKAMKIDRREGRTVRKRRCFHIKQALYYFGELTLRMVARELLKTNGPSKTQTGLGRVKGAPPPRRDNQPRHPVQSR